MWRTAVSLRDLVVYPTAYRLVSASRKTLRTSGAELQKQGKSRSVQQKQRTTVAYRRKQLPTGHLCLKGSSETRRRPRWPSATNFDLQHAGADVFVSFHSQSAIGVRVAAATTCPYRVKGLVHTLWCCPRELDGECICVRPVSAFAGFCTLWLTIGRCYMAIDCGHNVDAWTRLRLQPHLSLKRRPVSWPKIHAVSGAVATDNFFDLDVC